MQQATSTGLDSVMINSYGPYAFGVAALGFIVLLFLLVFRIVAPTLTRWIEMHTTATKANAEAMMCQRETAGSLERSLAHMATIRGTDKH